MSDHISASTLSDLIAAIYDCALDPGKWPLALEAIRNEERRERVAQPASPSVP